MANTQDSKQMVVYLLFHYLRLVEIYYKIKYVNCNRNNYYAALLSPQKSLSSQMQRQMSSVRILDLSKIMVIVPSCYRRVAAIEFERKFPLCATSYLLDASRLSKWLILE